MLSDGMVGELCSGEKNDELRNHLKAVTDKAWPLVNWLTRHAICAIRKFVLSFDPDKLDPATRNALEQGAAEASKELADKAPATTTDLFSSREELGKDYIMERSSRMTSA